MMSKKNLLLVCSFVFVLCCSMSKCDEDNTPQPSTTIHGVVTEDITGNPITNVRFQIEKRYSTGLFQGNKIHDYDIVTTDVDGTFKLTFTPQGKGDYSLKKIPFTGADSYIPTGYSKSTIELGKDNTLNFTLQRLVNVNVHLINKSNQNKPGFHVFIFTCCTEPFNAQRSDDYRSGPIDTTLKYKLPQLSSYTFQSLYYNGYIQSGPNVGGFADTLSFKKNFYLSKKDTVINVVNP